jgi:hypothetical protein
MALGHGVLPTMALGANGRLDQIGETALGPRGGMAVRALHQIGQVGQQGLGAPLRLGRRGLVVLQRQLRRAS